MKKSAGRVITVTRITDYDFDIEITWDRDRQEMHGTPQRLLEKFPPFDDKDKEILSPLLSPVITADYASHPFACEWLEYVISQYFKGGRWYVVTALQGGPEAYKTRRESMGYA